MIMNLLKLSREQAASIKTNVIIGFVVIYMNVGKRQQVLTNG
jgi:hypothetical protein